MEFRKSPVENMVKFNKILQEDFDFINETIKDLDFLKNTTWLITGASGMLGSYLVNYLFYVNESILKNSIKIDLILRKKSKEHNKNIRNLFNNKNVNFLIRDLSKNFRLDYKNYNYIIHASSKAAPKTYLGDPIGTINLNVRATQKLLEIAIRDKEIKKFLFFSSGEIYGNPELQYIPTPEEYIGRIDHLNDRSCYVESKRFGETLVSNFNKAFALPTNIIRPIHIYGPGISNNDSRVWADFIYSALEHKDLTILGDGKAIRGFCYIRDYLLQLLIILKLGKNGEIYNIGNEKGYSIEELAEVIANVFEKQPKINILNKNIDANKNSPVISIPSIAKVKNLFNFSSTDLDEGIRRTIDWIKIEKDGD